MMNAASPIIPRPLGRFALATFLIFVIFQQAVISVTGWQVLGYVDELVIAALVAVLVTDTLLRARADGLRLFVLGSAAYFLVISLFFGEAQPANAVVQVLIHLKLFLLYLLVRAATPGTGDIRWLERIFLLLVLISMVGYAANFVMQDAFYELFGARGAGMRYGVLRIEGFQLKPNDLAILLAVFGMYAIFRIGKSASPVAVIILAMGIAALLLGTGSRTALAAVPLALLGYFVAKKGYRAVPIVVVVLAILGYLAAVPLTEMLTTTSHNLAQLSNIENTRYIRGIMLYYGWQLSWAHFPIGAGAATYGSSMSASSPVYQDMGLDEMSFFQDMQGIYDSNIATILGEFGAVGMVLFAIGTIILYLKTSRNCSGYRYCRFYAMTLLGYAVLVSITNPLFMYSYNGLLFAIAIRLAPALVATRGKMKVVAARRPRAQSGGAAISTTSA